jgi:acetyltransferase-like isoleucine patch superfamily enzyme
MLGRLFKKIGYALSYVFTYNINERINLYKNYLYTGWISRRFRQFDGYIEGRITVVGANNISVGEKTIIQDNVRLLAWDRFHNQEFTPEITIGRNSFIQKDCFLSAVDKIIIGDNVAVTEHTMILDNVHGDFQDNHLTFNNNQEVPDVFLQNAYTRPIVSKGPVVIENDVHIGMYCQIMPGTIIGHHSVIAAHSVVARKIPPYSLVAGNPAEIIITFGRKKKQK